MTDINNPSPKGKDSIESNREENNNKEIQDPELRHIILHKLLQIIIELDNGNFDNKYKEIHYILNHHSDNLVLELYYKKLIHLLTPHYLSIAKEDLNTKPFNPVERLFDLELKLIAKDLFNCNLLVDNLRPIFSTNFSVLDFINRFSLDSILALVIVIKFESLIKEEDLKQFKAGNSLKLFELVLHRHPTDYNFKLILELVLNSNFFPFAAKLFSLEGLYNLKDTFGPVKNFYNHLKSMSFNEIVSEMGPENLSPNRLLTLLLRIEKKEIVLSLALILKEVLLPGSQKLSQENNGLTNLAANSLVESTAKGTQLQVCFKNVDSDPSFDIDWYLVFAKVQELFSDEKVPGPSLNNINQVLAAIDFKPGMLDIFLNFDFSFNFSLLLALHSLDPKQGAYDIVSLNGLAKSFDDIETPIETQLGRRNIISFINVGKLEIVVMSIIKSRDENNMPRSDQERILEGKIAKIFEHHLHTFPEYLLSAALAAEERDKNIFIMGLIDSLFTLLMDNNSTFLTRILQQFKELDQYLTFSRLLDYYSKRQSTEAVFKIIKVCLSIEFLNEFIAEVGKLNLAVALNFAINASFFDYDCTPLIEAKFNDPQTKQLTCQSILEILELRSNEDFEKAQEVINDPSSNFKILRIPMVYYLLEKLKGSKRLVDGERLKNLQLQLLTTYPRLINFGCGHDEAILANGQDANIFPGHVEQEMKAYYSKMYNKELEIKDIVDMLIRLKSSDSPHDQDVFACMIHSLLDEYRFFPEYPLNALASTSLLFGALLQKDIIQGTTLTVALNFIWESCNQPQDSHLFKFAVQALYNFKSRLHEYPIYCKHLLECKSFSAHAKMYQIVSDASKGIPCVDQPFVRSASNSVTPVSGSEEDSGFKYQSIAASSETVGLSQQERPHESVSDKLLFFINNLTGDNLKEKLSDIKTSLTENYFLWFADYLVADRAKSEPNNHQLYSSFVTEFDNAIFYEYVLNVTLTEVNHLIRNFKDTFNERNHLKNLGAWLGQITLANDRPLKRKQIGMKFLLVEAFDFKTLNHIVPFVCKILDQAQYSKIFRPPNPWVLGIIKVLVELYECADLKLNLKFEIEVLLNSFHLKINDIEASTIIRTHNPSRSAVATLFGLQPNAASMTNDFAKMGIDYQDPSQFEPQIPNQSYMQPQPQLQMQQPQVVQHRGAEDGMSNKIPAANNQLDTSFSTLIGNTIFTQNPNLRRAFQASLSRAVRECAIPILSRTSESVLTTTEALIKKDFAYEADVTKFRKAYQTLSLKLSQSMIACSGRKILSETIEGTMIQLLAHQINPNELPLGELNSAIQSNVDLCVDIVNKIAAGNVIELIEERMSSSVAAREQQPPGTPFVEKGSNSDYALQLPPPLGLRPEGLSPTQMAIYEAFGSNIVHSDSAAQPQMPQGLQQVPPTPQGLVASSQPVPNHPPGAAPAQQAVAQQTPQQQVASLQQEEFAFGIEQLFTAMTQNCDRAIQCLTDAKETSLSQLSPDHPIMGSITNVLAIAQSNALKFPELLLKAAQYAVNCLFTQTHENPMSGEIYVVILDKLCEYSPSTAKDVTWWLVHSSDQRKLNMPVMYSLLKVQLVQPVKFDSSIGKLISETQNGLLVKFASSLLYKIFSSKDARPVALKSEFSITLKALSEFKGDPALEDNREILQTRDDLFKLLEDPAESEEDLYMQMGYVFSEWVRLLNHGDDCEDMKVNFINGLLKSGILTEPDFFGVFFKSAVEVAITSFGVEHDIRSRTLHENLLAVDALAQLIVKIILMFDKNAVKESMNYLKSIMGIILVALTNDHEIPNGSWNERAYFRLFSSILCYWSDALVMDANSTSHLDKEFFNFIGDVLNSLQPIIFPGFTFAWISLISHRMFLPKVLELPNKAGHNTLVRLLVSLLRFETIYSRDEAVNNDVINVIFKSINRIFVGIYHDHPEFLAENYIQLITSIPSNYIQLRNLVLSATPKGIPLENPFTPGLKVERIPELKQDPTINYQPAEDLLKYGLKKPVDNFLRIPAPALVKTIYNGLKLSSSKTVNGFGYQVTNYNLDLINSLVFYVAISEIHERPFSNTTKFNPKSSHVVILHDLMNYGTTEFKYHLINAIANHARYPNSHTHWLVSIFLHFFSTDSLWNTSENKSVVQELITRVLIERHMVNKPHQWGLTIVFTELIKNGHYSFFELPFIKNAPPEIKLIFDALLQNVNGLKNNPV